ncbi:MAG: thermonuclease family protein [Clostridia bacterium]|nr:thermonuclease family protein [Clostridia bacterium]
MNKRFRLLSLVLLLAIVLSCAACGPAGSDGSSVDTIDYAASVKLDMSSETAKEEVTVHSFIDGDTTHFNLSSEIDGSHVLKVRYLAINTPESTGKIEEFGKAAARFTRERLSQAVSIIVESESAKWESDSTGGRYLAWVWYKTAEDAEYRNLNVEILQNGFAIPSSATNSRYGEACVAAVAQAKRDKLNVHSGQKDPEFYYGEAIELTLKELRCNIKSYDGQKVAFNGIVTRNDNNSVYVETYDSETGLYYGISVYYGYNLNGDGLNILSIGNEVRIVGSLQFYEVGGTYQISDVKYRQMKPDDPGNIQKISDGHSAAYPLTSPETFANGKVTIVNDDDTVTEHDYAALVMDTSIAMEGLTVQSIRSISEEGEMTLICRAGDVTIPVRTAVLRDADGKTVTEDYFLGKTIDVKGIVDYFSGDYQIRVLTLKDITIHN